MDALPEERIYRLSRSAFASSRLDAVRFLCTLPLSGLCIILFSLLKRSAFCSR